MSVTFTCRPNSHPFQERHISIQEPIKIGRSVARARPAPNNAIFDCKVLSRNHALLWYENNTFYLQDTKSSNGTFVNNQRLSKGSEESPPQEIFSGDLVQFGVDVMENSRRVTHSCIIASVQLFHSDGREATNSHSSPFLSSPGSPLTAQSQELYQLAQYLQEALHREQMLENKLASLQSLVQNTQEASDSGWQALIDEDRLLSRLEVLENQLATCSKNQTEDTLRQELVALQEDKYNYETTAKESLRKVLQEKLEAVRKLSDLERSLGITEDECSHLREMCESSQTELQELAEKHQEQLQEIQSLQEQLQEAERKQQEEVENVEKEKTDLQAKLEEMVKQESQLHAKVESIQADNDFTKEQLTNIKVKMEALKENNGGSPRIMETESQGVQVDLVSLLDLKMLRGQTSDDSDDDEMDDVKPPICGDSGSDSDGDDNEKDVTTIEEAFENPKDNKVNGKDEVKDEAKDADKDRDESEDLNEEALKEKLKDTQAKVEYYKGQLEVSSKRLKTSQQGLDKLQTELDQAKSETVSQRVKIVSLEEKLSKSEATVQQMVDNAVADLTAQLTEFQKQAQISAGLVKQLQGQIAILEQRLQGGAVEAVIRTTATATAAAPPPSSPASQGESLQQEVEKLKDMLQEAKQTHRRSEERVTQSQAELESHRQQLSKSSETTKQLQTQLSETQKLAKEKADHVCTLQDRLSKMECSAKDVKQQIITLRDRLLEEQEQGKANQKEGDKLRKQLQEAQQSGKQAKNEAEQLRMRLRSLQEELDFERSTRSLSSATSAHQEIQNQAAKNRVEFTSLKEECTGLRQRIQDIETEMRTSRIENQQLQTDYGKLQQSYSDLELMKDKLENKETLWKLNLTDAQKSAELIKEELTNAQHEIAVLKAKCARFELEISQLKATMGGMEEEYGALAYRTKTLSTCSMIPLLMLMFAFIVAFYPALSSLTATSTPES